MEEWSEHYQRGLNALKAGDASQAVTELEAASRLHVEDYRIFNGLGAAYAANGLYEKAIGAFKTAEQMAPNIARIHYNIAQAYEAVGIPTEAEYEYEKAVSLEPSYTKAQEALAAIKSRLNHV
jgi:Flp pilus assembly protein TadD